MLHKVKEVVFAEHTKGTLYHVFCWNVHTNDKVIHLISF